MSSKISSRICSICKKIFCCAECRIRHEKNKHSERELNCPFCKSEKLPLRVFEDKKLYCHIVFNHLPLHCYLCGIIFTTSVDLENYGPCKWWSSKCRHSLTSNVKPEEEVGTPSPTGLNLNSKLVSQRSSIDGDFSSVFVSFTSPPEFNRNTSTPMHVNVESQKINLDFKTPCAPNFTLKSPKTGSATSKVGPEAQSRVSLDSKSSNSNNYHSFPSLESDGSNNTPYRSMETNRSSNASNSQNSKINFNKKLGVMEELDENNADVEFVDVENRTDSIDKGLLDEENTKPPNKELSSRYADGMELTRSSMQHEDMEQDMELTDVQSNNVFVDDMEQNGVCQWSNTRNADHLDVAGMHGKNGFNIRGTTRGSREFTRSLREDRGKVERLYRSINSSSGNEIFMTPPSQEAEVEIFTDKTEKRTDSVKRVRFSDNFENENLTAQNSDLTGSEEFFEAQESFGENPVMSGLENQCLFRGGKEKVASTKEVKSSSSSSSSLTKEIHSQKVGSSRVVMMLVVENNSTFSTNDLTPLINSSLKQLEDRISENSRNNEQMVEESEKKHPRIARTASRTRRSITSMNSYFSVSNVECYSNAESPNSTGNNNSKSSGENNDVANTSGLFSAVAHAVRSALKNITGGSNSKNMEKSPVMSATHINSDSSIAESLESNQIDSNASTNYSSSSSSSFLPRPGKRTRDSIESPSLSSKSESQSDITSPIAKRHRAWYRIKSREPISRMRNKHLTSPKGISLETQVFRQGSLSVRDTILPIPSRAHQSTQTE